MKQIKHIKYYNGTRTRRILSKIKTFLINFGHINFNKRIHKIKQFRDSIPHSPTFFHSNIKKINAFFDVLIVGSDQVWNPNSINDFYMLNFAEKNKVKISYAASIGKNSLSFTQTSLYKDFLSDYQAISIREKEGVDFIKNLGYENAQLCLDPTLLLSKLEWDEICSKRLISEKYVFCYFLSENVLERKNAKEFARKRGLKIVTLPHLAYKKRQCDVSFGDHQLYNVSPQDFISLIKYSECVFTDSFHATVFSLIYEKQFFSFDDCKTETSSRITTLLKIFNAEKHFVNKIGDMNLNHIESVDQIIYSNNNEFDSLKQLSLSFLKRSIKNDKNL